MVGWAGIHVVLPLIMAAGSVQAGPKHVIFAFVDHFEPSGSVSAVNETTDIWVNDYIAMASQHTDADGRHPVHSYFLISIPSIQSDRLHNVLTKLNQVTYNGYGEVEFHCHHGVSNETYRTEQEATNDLINLIAQAKFDFNMHGALITAEAQPRIAFGFIHGMWALDNSRFSIWYGLPHHEYCGVNRELELLRREGSYADFTFPAWGPMEPLIHDVIFYAADDEFSASYQNPKNIFLVEVNKPPMDDLMIIQGPNENTNIGVVNTTVMYYDWPSLLRMDTWVSHKVRVIGNDDWIFVKVFTHGCAGNLHNSDTWDCFFGASIDKFYRDIEKKYNDGISWRLHYVSAREMYNIVKAAEAGRTGNPNDYRDFIIPPYANMVILTNNQYRLVKYDANEAVLEILDNPETVEVSIKRFDADAGILESDNETGPWQISDAMRQVGQFGELHLQDTTPSRYYYIIKPF
jgi:hypothetical protein